MTLAPTSSHGSAGLSQAYVGYNTAGGSFRAVGGSGGIMFAKSVTLSAASHVLSVDGYVKGNANNFQACFAAIYDNAAGTPGKCIAINSPGRDGGDALMFQVNMTTVARWVSTPLGTTLAAATYWLIFFGSNNLSLAYDAAGTDQEDEQDSTWFLENTAAWSVTANNYSIRASVLS